MSRRKPIPGQLSLFDLPATVPTPARKTPPLVQPVVPKAVTPEMAQRDVPRIPQPDYMRDGVFHLPRGVRQPPCMAHWYCVVSADGSRDALAVLYRLYSKHELKEIEDISGVLEIPILGRRWEDHGNWLFDLYIPSMDALEAYAAETLGISTLDVKMRHYLTVAHSAEQRFEQRTVPHLGTVRPTIKGVAA